MLYVQNFLIEKSYRQATAHSMISLKVGKKNSAIMFYHTNVGTSSIKKISYSWLY